MGSRRSRQKQEELCYASERAQAPGHPFHQAVFGFVLTQLGRRGLLKGKTIGIGATTLEANAAMRSIVRRDTSDAAFRPG